MKDKINNSSKIRRATPDDFLVDMVLDEEKGSATLTVLTHSREEFVTSWVQGWINNEKPKEYLSMGILLTEILINDSDEGKNESSKEVISFFKTLNQFLNYINEKNLPSSIFNNDTEGVVEAMLHNMLEKPKTKKDKFQMMAGEESIWKKINDYCNRVPEVNDPAKNRIMKGRIFEDNKIDWLDAGGFKTLLWFIKRIAEYESPRIIAKPISQDNGYIYEFIKYNFTIGGKPISVPDKAFHNDIRKSLATKYSTFEKRINNLLNFN